MAGDTRPMIVGLRKAPPSIFIWRTIPSISSSYPVAQKRAFYP